MKEGKQHRNSQSIYFVTGGEFEKDKEEDGGWGGSQGTLQFQFNIVFFLSGEVFLLHADSNVNIFRDTLCWLWLSDDPYAFLDSTWQRGQTMQCGKKNK